MDNIGLREACEKVIELSKDQRAFHYVVTPNVDHVMKLQKDMEFRKIYEQASLVLPDGQPLVWASRFLKKPLKEKVSGSDLFPIVCGMAAREKLKVFFSWWTGGCGRQRCPTVKGKVSGLGSRRYIFAAFWI
nr:WecB/TagA/CpsF family glycosyltransferase [Planococcus glaciei]